MAAHERGVDGGAVYTIDAPLFNQLAVRLQARAYADLSWLWTLKDGRQILVRWQGPGWIKPAPLLCLLA
jgi:hypothetical protein